MVGTALVGKSGRAYSFLLCVLKSAHYKMIGSDLLCWIARLGLRYRPGPSLKRRKWGLILTIWGFHVTQR